MSPGDLLAVDPASPGGLYGRVSRLKEPSQL